MKRLLAIMLTLSVFCSPYAHAELVPTQTAIEMAQLSPVAANILRLYEVRAPFADESTQAEICKESKPTSFENLSPYAQAKFLYMKPSDYAVLNAMQNSFQTLFGISNLAVTCGGKTVPASTLIKEFEQFFILNKTQAVEIFSDDMLSKWLHLTEEKNPYDSLSLYQKAIYNSAAFILHPTVTTARKSAFLLGTLGCKAIGYFNSDMCFPSLWDTSNPPTEDTIIRQLVRGTYNSMNIETFAALQALRMQFSRFSDEVKAYIPTTYKIGPKGRYVFKKTMECALMTLAAGCIMSAQSHLFGTTAIGPLVMASRQLPQIAYSCANNILDDIAHDAQFTLCNGFYERQKNLPKLIEQTFFPTIQRAAKLRNSLLRMTDLAPTPEPISFALPAERSLKTIISAIEIVETIGLMELAFINAQATHQKELAIAASITAQA
jgi:hypothetical protein